MQITASWGGESVSVEVDAECRGVEGLKRCLQEALPEVDVEAVRLEVCGRPVDDEAVLGLVEGSVVDVSASQAALAAAALREEGRAVDFEGFCRAAQVEDLRLCKLYLEAGVLIWPPGVQTPLHIAAGRNHQELCELLLASGCDKDAQDILGYTPLHRAIYNGSTRAAELLLESGCDREVKDNGGNTPLHWVIMKDNTQTAELLLKSGCDINKKNNKGSTPLHWAVMKDNMHMAELLLKSGCDIDKKHDDGNTPLHWAITRGNTQMVKLLLESVKNDDGETPLCG